MTDPMQGFIDRFGDSAAVEVLERISDAHWNGGKGEGVTLSDIYQHDACNHTLSGSIEHGNETFHFIIDSGNWNGTVVKQWGTIDEVGVYEPEKPLRLTFVPIAAKSMAIRIYLLWLKEPWFVEWESKLNYDTHFAPGGKTRSYYSEWAAKKGMKICVREDDHEKHYRALLKKLEAQP